MNRFLLLLLASVAATPAAAQSHQGHHMPGMSMPGMTMPVAKPAAKKKTAAKKKAAPAKKAVAGKAAAKPKPKAAPPRRKPAKAADPHAGHTMPMDTADPHAGHDMTGQTGHEGHGATAPAPPLTAPPTEALGGPAHAADALFGVVDMAQARHQLQGEHGGMHHGKVLIDQLEARTGKGRTGYYADAEAWYGGDIDKLWLKTEVEGERGRTPEQTEGQALWSHAIDPWFDLQGGVRFDANPGPNRTHLVLGLHGLAPYWWELDGAVFLSNKGEVTVRAEAEYDLRITQKLVLQPRLEVDLSAQDVRELGIGSGLTSADLGLRLRYQISQQFAPYAGLSYERSFGDTRKFRREDGEAAGGLKFVTGLRFWF